MIPKTKKEYLNVHSDNALTAVRSTRSREQAKFKMLFDDTRSHQIDYKYARDKLLGSNYLAIEKFSTVFPTESKSSKKIRKSMEERQEKAEEYLPPINEKILEKIVQTERKREEKTNEVTLPQTKRPSSSELYVYSVLRKCHNRIR